MTEIVRYVDVNTGPNDDDTAHSVDETWIVKASSTTHPGEVGHLVTTPEAWRCSCPLGENCPHALAVRLVVAVERENAL
jgi:SWIM zinc finger